MVRIVILILAACSTTTTGPTQPTTTADPAEPAKPVIECNVTEVPVFCEPGTPTRTALQPSPFHWCAREKPTAPGSGIAIGGTGRLFSAAQTRIARAKDPEACCYLEWTWSACD